MTDRKILTAFVGKCWHTGYGGHINQGKRSCVLCPEQVKVNSHGDLTNIDFTTPEGYQLLADEIRRRVGWYEFYLCEASKLYGHFNSYDILMAARKFHEKQLSEKSALVLEAIKAGVFEEAKHE